MKKFVVLLRGINVGGGNKIKMADLTKVLESKGFQQVKTYIQSGNIVFLSELERPKMVSEIVSYAIKEAFDLKIPAIVFDEDSYVTMVEAEDWAAFDDFDSKKAYYTFFNEAPENSSSIDGSVFVPDVFKIEGAIGYLYLPNGAGRTKLTNLYLEKLTKKIATTRNYNTTHKMVELLSEIED